MSTITIGTCLNRIGIDIGSTGVIVLNIDDSILTSIRMVIDGGLGVIKENRGIGTIIEPIHILLNHRKSGIRIVGVDGEMNNGMRRNHMQCTSNMNIIEKCSWTCDL